MRLAALLAGSARDPPYAPISAMGLELLQPSVRGQELGVAYS
jgi:hypothetical protein